MLPLVILCSSRPTCSFEESAWKEITEDDDKNEHPNDDKNSKLNISYFFQLLHGLTALIIRIPKPVSKNRRIIK